MKPDVYGRAYLAFFRRWGVGHRDVPPIYVDRAGRAHWLPDFVTRDGLPIGVRIRVTAGPLHSEISTGDWSARVPFSSAARWLLALRPHNPRTPRIAA